MTILEKIKSVRLEKKISTRKMGEMLNMSYGTYRDIENGKIRLTLENLLSICASLKIDAFSLLKKESGNYILLSEKDAKSIKTALDVLSNINNQLDILNKIHENEKIIVRDNHGEQYIAINQTINKK